MKKQLLAGAFVLASFLTAQAQELVTENFDTFTVGNVSENITGEEPGQNDWFVQATNGTGTGVTTTNMDASTFQIVAEGGEAVNVLHVTGPNGSGGAGYMFRTDFADAWAGRTEGNNIVQVTFDYYTGTASETKNNFQVVVYNADYSKTMAGIQVNAGTLEVRGLAWYTSTPGTGLYNFGLGSEEEPAVILPEESWVTLAFVYDVDSGIVLWAGPGIPEGAGIQGVAAGEEPAEVDFITVSGATSSVANTVAGEASFDNLNVSAFGTAGVGENALANLSVFPNPANDVVNVTVDALVSNVAIVDLNGRTVKTAKFDGVSSASVNVSDLASGVYMMTISSDKGTTTKKIVKN